MSEPFTPTVEQLFDPEVCLGCGGYVLHGGLRYSTSCNHQWNGFVRPPAQEAAPSSAPDSLSLGAPFGLLGDVQGGQR